MKTNKKGISLIVLVITIIVMIILATAVVLTLAQNGIIGKANEAVKEMNEAQVKQAAQLAWADVSLSSENKDSWTQDDWTYKVEERLKLDGIDISDFTIEATKDGITVTKKPAGGTTIVDGWTQTGTTVTDGNVTLNVGAYIDYKANVDGYTDEKGWIVLGAKDGELLIMSANNVVGDFTLGSAEDISVSKEDFVTGVSKLNGECAGYGEGTHATHVRSVTREDIDRVAMYDPETFTGQDYFDMIATINDWDAETKAEVLVQSGGEKALAALDYGRTLTFEWNDTEYPTYSYTLEGQQEPISNKFTDTHSKFIWYDFDSNKWRESVRKTDADELGTITSDDEDKKTATITNNFSGYIASDKINTDTLAYEMLIGTTSVHAYWLASPIVVVTHDGVDFGIGTISDGTVDGCDMVYSNDYKYGIPSGVRAVVHLDSNVQVTRISDSVCKIAN